MTEFLLGAALFVLGTVALGLIRILRGPEDADRMLAAQLLGTPTGLANALERLGRLTHQIPMAEASPNTAHMFIVSPLSGKSFVSLVSTHPPLEKRIERLRGMTLSR